MSAALVRREIHTGSGVLVPVDPKDIFSPYFQFSHSNFPCPICEAIRDRRDGSSSTA